MGSYLKASWKALLILMILHFLGIVGVVGYLAGTDRLSKDRLEKVKDLFTLTLADQKVKDEELAEAIKQEQSKQDKINKLLSIEDKGLQARGDVIKSSQDKTDSVEQQLETARMINQAIQTRVGQAIAQIERDRKEIDEKIKKFDEEVKRQTKLAEDESFEKALGLITAAEAVDAKRMFESLMAGGKTDVVVDYINAMSPRKANEILTEFKTVEEQKTRAMLVDKVRTMALERLKTAAGQE